MDALSRLVSTLLLNAAWEIAVVAAAGMLGDMLLRRGPARYRHGLWVASLVTAIFLPLASLRQPTPRVAPFLSLSADASSIADAVKSDALTSLRRVEAGPRGGWWSRASLASSHRTLLLPRSLTRAALVFYLGFLALAFTRFARTWLRTREIRLLAGPVDPLPTEVAEALGRCYRSWRHDRLRNVPGTRLVFSSAHISGPVTLGVRRPAIILPAALLDSAAGEDLDAALAHEMAHICRRDYFCNLVYELLLLPFAFHPLALFIRQRLGDTRELACDELAAQVLSTPIYAQSLVRLANEMSRQASPTLRPDYTLGVFDANILEERVMRLLKPRASAHLARLLFLSAAILISSFSFAAARFSIGIGQPAAASPATQSGPDQPFATFLGTWTAKFEGETYVVLRLKLQDRQLAGTISTGEMNLDPSGNVNEVTEEAQNPVSIFDTKVDGGKLYFKQKDGNDTLNYEMEVSDAGRARLKILNNGPATVQPFDLVRETGSANRSSEAGLTQVAYAGKNYVMRGVVSGGIKGGVGGGILAGAPETGTVPGGINGTISEKIAGGQGGEVPSKNEPETGSLSGIVVDSSGARIPNAEVRLISRNNSFHQSVQSDETGNFSFDDVPAGRYTLEVSSQGMGGVVRSFEFKAEGEPPFFPFVLHPGSVSEAVAVTAKSRHNFGDKATRLGPRRIRVGGAVEAAKVIDDPSPHYPGAAKSRGAQGMVVLLVTIAADGTPKEFKVISSPDDDLTKAALDAVKKWRYQPTLLNGDPVEVVTTIDINFTLQD